jgi:DNA invertase Pin-like site-specific DNA recombinase
MLAIYTRLSREDSDSTSIENQLREGKSFAKENGFKNIEIYNEGQGVSGGANIKDRPQLFKLLQDFRDNNIKAVWFRNQNRLERNSNTWHIFTTDAKKFNVSIYFNDKLFDFENPQDNLFGTITSALNQYQKDLQSAQTKRTLRDNAEEGKVWSVVAYGYKSDNGYLAIEETESKIVKEIFDLSLSGVGSDSIAKRLNERKIKTRKGGLWRGATIQNILKNTIYKGDRKFSEKIYKSPIIIEPNYWQKVNNNFKNNRNNSGKKVDHKYLLKGVLKCGKCGRNYYGRKRVDKSDNYYQCSSTRHKDLKCGNRGLNIDVLEGFIWSRFFADKRILEITKDYLNNEEIEGKLGLLRGSKSNIDRRLDSLEKERKRALDLVIKEVITEDDFKSTDEKIRREKTDYNIKLKNISEQINFYKDSELTKEKVENDLSHISEVSFNDKRELIRKYIESITIDYKEPYYIVRVEFKINNHFTNNDKFYTDFFGNTEEIDSINMLKIESNLVENYIIDRGYNIAIDVCYNYLYPISKKVKTLDDKELKIYADKVENDFSIKHNPIIDIENNTISFS